MVNMIKLSIAISTFNRAKYLKECLDSIKLSAKGYENELEIIVSNNGCLDDTEDVISRFKKVYPRLRYHRHEKNIGAEQNFYFLANFASGKYLWIFGDDDKVQINAIPAILQKIKTGHDVMITNYSTWSQDFSVSYEERFLPFEQDQEIKDPDELMKMLGIKIGFTSAVIIRKDLFLRLPKADFEAFMKYGNSFTYAVYNAVNPECNACCVARPLVCYRGSNSKEYQDPFIWYRNFAVGGSLLMETLRDRGFSRDSVYQAKHEILKDYVIHHISFSKREGKSLRGIFTLLLPYYKKYWFFWFVCVPALFAPRFLVWIVNRTVVLGRKFKHLSK